jgi:hypothetical protein
VQISNKKREAYSKAHGAISREPNPEKWTMSQLRALISFQQVNTDSWALLKTKPLFLEKWQELKDRPTPPPSPVRMTIGEIETASNDNSDIDFALPIAQTEV